MRFIEYKFDKKLKMETFKVINFKYLFQESKGSIGILTGAIKIQIVPTRQIL